MRSDLVTVFERAPILAERVAARVDATDGPERIIQVTREELGKLSEAERVRVLNAHPRLGADPASLSALSRHEQGTVVDAAAVRELATLNDDYERKFGFRFVVWVHGRGLSGLVAVFRARLARSRADELTTGLEEFLAITADRLAKERG